MSNDSKSFSSVGIDIGSTTTHLIFSKLTLELDKEKHKYEIARRDITYLSRVTLTPYAESNSIDMEQLSSFLFAEYKAAGCSPEEIDTGAIIITGEAAKKHNAERIVRLFSDQMGKFVCATAGPNYEAVLAAYGSGAVERSGKANTTIMNVDIGGGTSKFAIAQKGEVVDTACVSVGARLIAVNESGKVIRIEEPGQLVAKDNGIQLTMGKPLSKGDQQKIGMTLARCLYEVMSRGRLSKLTGQLMVTPPLSYAGKIDEIVFSGGVAEYIYGCTDQEFGDLGKILGNEIMTNSKKSGILISEPAERIRATVIGVSQYTVQVSGNTTFLSSPDLLPMRNLPVVSPDLKAMTDQAMMEAIRNALEMHDIIEGEGEFALAFRRSVLSNPTHQIMRDFGKAVLASLEMTVKKNKPLVLVFEADIGMGIGRVIKEELNSSCKLVSIDEIKLEDFNFIDIGEPTEKGRFIPVVVKSLIFPKEPTYGNT